MDYFDVKRLAGKVIIVVGHFGCGKTNVSINLAEMLSRHGKTYLIDYDNVNPYFRAADSYGELSGLGVSCVASEFANTNVDIPSVSPLVFSALTAAENGASVVFDVGGDMLGAMSLGYLKQKLDRLDPLVLCVFNACRPMTDTPQGAYEVLTEIEAASGLKAGALVNNSNAGGSTDAGMIEETEGFAAELSRLSSLPVLFTSFMTEEPPRMSGEILRIKNKTKKLF
ncbi:MAG: hypothetical protein J5879_06230 [Clostridia bacterium]|nr:hypothetical protein [Clostridia bacterium]